nr:MAG TPA: hypothetical protein [Caudoviricetes sp.]
MTDAEKLAELKKWARSFLNRCTQDVNHWEKLNEKKLELKAFGMVQAMDVVMNKIEELDNEKAV